MQTCKILETFRCRFQNSAIQTHQRGFGASVPYNNNRIINVKLFAFTVIMKHKSLPLAKDGPFPAPKWSRVGISLKSHLLLIQHLMGKFQT